MLSKSANFKIDTDGTSRDITITPLFLRNQQEPWQPNEIYELTQTPKGDSITEPTSMGKIIVDDHMDWHYEGEHKLSDEEVEQIARFVLMQI